MRRKFLLVRNSIAGIAGRRLVDRVADALIARGASIETAPPGDSGPDLAPLSRTSFDAAIAAGGDGTFRALAKALGPSLPIGFVPMGTGNVLAHEIGLPRGPAAIAEVLMHGPAIDIEGATANGEPFFLMAGAGFDGEVISRLNTPLKRRIGKAAYVGPVLGALSLTQHPLSVEIDGNPASCGWIVVAKAQRYGGSFVIAPEAGITRPGLIAVLFQSTSRAARLKQLLALAGRLLSRDSSVRMMRCSRVRIASDPRVAVEIDGDPFGQTPLEIVAGGAAARLIVPASFRP